MDGQENEERRQNNSIVTNKVKEEARKKIAKKVSETSAKLASKGSIFAALGPILFWVLIIIVAIIIAVGIIMFFMTVPGMVMEQLKSFASDFADAVCSWFGADSAKQIEEQQTYDVLNYLEQMGYDIKGYGFISENADENDANYDEKTGVIRDPDTGTIKDLDSGKWIGGKREAYSDIINLYIMSDNYVYTIRNFNNVSTWWKGFKWLQAIGEHIVGLFGADTTKWGKGLISLYKEGGGNIGEQGGAYKNGIFSWNDISVDASSKTMTIRKGWGNKSFEYNLEGWTGRYGMPLEFLLSLHIATMKPDLTYEMVTNFDTEVKILLRTISKGSIAAAYKNSSGRYVTYEEVDTAIHNSKSDDVFNNIINWFDDNWGGLNKEEMEVLSGMGFGDDKDTIKEILDELDLTHAYDFETFVPYISRVSNHWFRDVYFILSENEVNSTLLTRTDIDYEKLTNERWTLYETYTEGDRKGEYKLYEYDETKEYGIGKLFEGTQEDANQKGVKVVKKPIKTTASDLASEKNGAVITLKSDGGWSAYEEKDTESSEYERVYPDEDESTIKGKIYYKVKLANNAVQTQDGLRGITNKDIKDMFLNRYYFSYDGSGETADIIKLAREQLNMGYGSIDESKLDTEISGTTNPEDDEPYQVKDLVSNVSITQDSLGAFSMLENTHTLDADYIYRDFKELIVELGYFTKEELSEGTPKLLQWLIPITGSAGYPKRVLDKNENELGTFAHSKQDYEANEKETLKELISQAILSAAPNAGDDDGNKVKGITSLAETVNGIREKNGNSDKFISVGGISEGSTSLLSLDEWWEETQKMFDVYKADGWLYDGHGPNGSGASHGCNAGTTFDQANDGSHEKTTDCSIGASWMLQKLGALKENHTFTSYMGDSGSLDESNVCAQDLLDAGAEVIVPPDGTKFSSAAQNGTLEPGDVLFYEGHVSIYCGDSYDGAGQTHCWDTGSTTGIQCGGPRDTSYEDRDIELIIRLPLGNRKVSNPYEGHLGDEAVVSPVTGILLEYGTYDEDDTDYRKNIDKTDKTDKVGYAKILVLTEEVADQLVTCSTHSKDSDSKKGVSGIITKSEPEDTKELKGWNEDEKAIYGYKYFKDDYVDGGIAGYLVYIDGFKCELPNEENQNEEDREEIVWAEDYTAGSGQELSMEYFKKLAARGSEKSMFKSCEYEETLYETDEVYKLLSEKLEDKQKARAETKNLAAPLYSFTGTLDGETQELLIIKEGTVIGRTYTDKEIVESRGETYTKPEKPKEGEEDTREVQGNYLRIIFRDLDDTVVENVEDYMKLDEEELKQQYDNFSVVGTVIPIEEWVELAYKYTTTHGCAAKFQDKDNLRKWYNLNVEKGVNPEYTFVRGIEESGLSDGHADSAGTNYWGYDTPNGSSSVKSFGSWEECLGKYCDTIVEYQDPSTWQYQEIMKRNNERESCTENGGIDPLGYGDPSTVGGQQCLYSWLGDNHLANSAGDGGMYYLYPWGWGGTQYEGENKIIFESISEFESLCGSKHGTSGGKTSSTATTVWEQGMYTAWQSRKVVNLAKEIFGERAGTYVG